MDIREIPAHLHGLGVDLSAAGTCLYASAGGDGRVLSHTHPEFLAERGASAVPELGVYVLLDRETPLDLAGLMARMGDDRTTVRALRHDSVAAFGLDGELLAVEWRSNTGRFGARTLAVMMLRTENEAAAPAFAGAGWIPDVFIGVCDGCRFGGNRHCVNRLTTWGLSAAAARHVPVPRWWITDHFGDASIPNPLEPGGVVRSVHPGFPHAFRKVALLASNWGRYGRGPMAGATLFELV